MVIDTSALLAILLGEEEAERFVELIVADSDRFLGAPTYVEAAAVMRAKRGAEGVVALNALLHELGIEVVEMSPDAGRLAAGAYGRFGKGIGSPGVLSLGDCLSYGVAIALGEPLLFKGVDYSQTDVESAG